MQQVAFVLVMVTLLVGCGEAKTLPEAAGEASGVESQLSKATSTREARELPITTAERPGTRPDWSKLVPTSVSDPAATTLVTPTPTVTLTPDPVPSTSTDLSTSVLMDRPPDVYFVPVGDVQHQTLKGLAKRYQTIRVLSPVSLPPTLRNSTRDQVAVEDILTLISQGYPDHARNPSVILIGITSEDLFSREQPGASYILQYVSDALSAVISDAHMRADSSADRAQLRLQKTVNRVLEDLYKQLYGELYRINVRHADINTVEALDALPLVDVAGGLLTPEDLPVASAYISVWAGVATACRELDNVQVAESADAVFTPLESEERLYSLLSNWVWTAATEEDAHQAMEMLRRSPNCPVLMQELTGKESLANLPITILDLVPRGDESIAVQQVLPDDDGADLHLVTTHLRVSKVLSGFLMMAEGDIDLAFVEDMARRLEERLRTLIPESAAP